MNDDIGEIPAENLPVPVGPQELVLAPSETVDDGGSDEPSDELVPDVDDLYWKLNSYVKMVANGESNALLVEASHGLGKSYQIKRTLAEEMGLRGPESVRTVGGHATPVELYHTLYSAKDGGVVFFDDISGIMSQKSALSLLKQCCWSDSDVRRVEWRSTSSKVEAPEQFQFRGRVVFCVNDMPDNKIVQSLKDRVLYYQLTFDYDERIRLVREVAKSPYKDLSLDERRECADFIERNTIPGSDVNLRTLFHIMDCRNFEPDRWRELGSEFVQADQEMVIVRRLLHENETVTAAAKAYAEETGKSKRTFYRKRESIDENQNT